MGTGKKEASRRERQGKSNDGMGNVRTKGENFYRYGFLSPPAFLGSAFAGGYVIKSWTNCCVCVFIEMRKK